MSDDNTFLLVAGINTFVGKQVVWLGVLMFSIGALIGINIVAQPVAAEYYSPLVGYTEMPWYMERAALASKLAAGASLLSTIALVYLDYTHD